jgi:hypothetical protein
MATYQDMNRNPLGLGGWKRGQSGNPSGRAKQTPDFLALARAQGQASLHTLIHLRDDPKIDPNIRRQCANDILDRAFGKPVQQTDIDVAIKPYLVVPDRRVIDALLGEDPRLIEHEPADSPCAGDDE